MFLHLFQLFVVIFPRLTVLVKIVVHIVFCHLFAFKTGHVQSLGRTSVVVFHHIPHVPIIAPVHFDDEESAHFFFFFFLDAKLSL